jgi:hypothetical protein
MTLAKKLFLAMTLAIAVSSTHARDYFIFSVMHDLPMTNDFSEIKKNYYINLGEKQGVRKGTIVDVYRQVTQNDPYESKKRYDYNIKIGELKVIHKDKDSSIAIVNKMMSQNDQDTIFEIPNFMVGDEVKVQIN